MSKKLSDYAIRIGILEPGPANRITDVDGVRVGHVTLTAGPARTGVTVIVPATGDAFRSKLLCGAAVFNGYGKSAGLVQIEELGTLETPIVLTNTFGVGDAARGLIEGLMAADPEIGRQAGTVNPLVLECNDGYLNDLRGLHVRPEHVQQALAAASAEVPQGSVGAGTGMSAYQLKGGIGTASRVADVLGSRYTVGSLVLTNMGRLADLTISGRPVGRELAAMEAAANAADAPADRGSIIMVIATDAPLSSRQLKRMARRSIVGLARTGSHMGQGSGEIAVCFSTANRVPHEADRLLEMRFLPDNRLDRLFDAVIETIEEAIIGAMLAADDLTGADGHRRIGLASRLDALSR